MEDTHVLATMAERETAASLGEGKKNCKTRPESLFWRGPNWSASPKPHPTKPHPCNMPRAKTEVALQYLESCAAEFALQHSFFCSADVIFTKSCAATNGKLHCNIEKLHCRKMLAWLPLQSLAVKKKNLFPANFWR